MRIKKKDILLEERVKSNIPVPSEVNKLYKLFKDNGFELYIVGGAVRDTLLGKPIKDYDFATDATPQQMIPFLKKNNIKHVPVEVGGKQAVMNIHMNDDYEVATFRADSKSGERSLDNFIKFIESKVSLEKLEYFKKRVMK